MFDPKKFAAIEEEPIKAPKRSLFDHLGDWLGAVKANYGDVTSSDELGDIRLKMMEPMSRERYDELSAQYDKLYKEREAYRNAYNQYQQALVDDDSSLKDFTQFGGTAQGFGIQALGSLAGAGLGAGVGTVLAPGAGTASGAATGWKIGNTLGALGSAHFDAKSVADAAAERVINETGNSELAKQAYDRALNRAYLTEIPDVGLDILLGGKIGGAVLGSKLGRKVVGSPVGQGVKKIAGINAPNSISTYVAAKTGSPLLGRVAGTAAFGYGEGKSEEFQEGTQDYIENQEVERANRLSKGLPDNEGDYSARGWLDYMQSPEGQETRRIAFKTGALMGGLGGAVASGHMLQDGTRNASDIKAGKSIKTFIENNPEYFNTPEGEERLTSAKRALAVELGLDSNDRRVMNLDVEDFARIATNVRTERMMEMGIEDRQRAQAIVRNDIINELTGDESGRMDFASNASKRYFESTGEDLTGDIGVIDKEALQAQRERLKQESLVYDKPEETFVTNSEKIADSTTTPYTEQRKEGQKERKPMKMPTALKGKLGTYHMVEEENNPYSDFDNTALYSYTDASGKEHRALVTRTDKKDEQGRWKYTVQDVTGGDESRPARVFNGKGATSNFLLGRAGREDRFQLNGNTQGMSGVSDVKGDIEDSRKIHTTQDLINFQDAMKGTESELSPGLFREIYRGIQRMGGLGEGGEIQIRNNEEVFGTDSQGNVLTDASGNKMHAYGSMTPLRQQVERDGHIVDETWTEDNPSSPDYANKVLSRAVVHLYKGADMSTAIHELSHVAYWKLDPSTREAFNRSVSGENEKQFVAKMLGREYNVDFIHELTTALGSKNNNLWDEIQKSGILYQTLDCINESKDPAGFQKACEERFAWEFTSWYFNGYTKNVQPRTLVQKIVDTVMRSMNQAIRLLTDTQAFLESQKDERTGATHSEIFEAVGLQGQRYPVSQTPTPLDRQVKEVPGMGPSPYPQHRAEQPTQAPVRQIEGTTPPLIGTQYGDVPQLPQSPYENWSEEQRARDVNNPEIGLDENGNRIFYGKTAKRPTRARNYGEITDAEYENVNSLQNNEETPTNKSEEKTDVANRDIIEGNKPKEVIENGISEDTGRTQDLQETGGEVQGRRGYSGYDKMGPGRQNEPSELGGVTGRHRVRSVATGRGDLTDSNANGSHGRGYSDSSQGSQGQNGRIGEKPPFFSHGRLKQRIKQYPLFRKVWDKLGFRTSADEWGLVNIDTNNVGSQFYLDTLSKAIKDNPKFGAYVDEQTIENLKGGRVVMHESGSAGFAITKDHTLVGVFKRGSTAPSSLKGASRNMTITARVMGATKIDCYGIGLLSMYAPCGFKPICRMKFNPKYVEDNEANSYLRRTKPDVYFLVAEDQSVETTLEKIARRQYKNYTQEELDNLPVVTSYEQALQLQEDLVNGKKLEDYYFNTQNGKIEKRRAKLPDTIDPFSPYEIAYDVAEKMSKSTIKKAIDFCRKQSENKRITEDRRIYYDEVANELENMLNSRDTEITTDPKGRDLKFLMEQIKARISKKGAEREVGKEKGMEEDLRYRDKVAEAITDQQAKSLSQAPKQEYANYSILPLTNEPVTIDGKKVTNEQIRHILDLALRNGDEKAAGLIREWKKKSEVAANKIEAISQRRVLEQLGLKIDDGELTPGEMKSVDKKIHGRSSDSYDNILSRNSRRSESERNTKAFAQKQMSGTNESAGPDIKGALSSNDKETLSEWASTIKENKDGKLDSSNNSLVNSLSDYAKETLGHEMMNAENKTEIDKRKQEILRTIQDMAAGKINKPPVFTKSKNPVKRPKKTSRQQIVGVNASEAWRGDRLTKEQISRLETEYRDKMHEKGYKDKHINVLLNGGAKTAWLNSDFVKDHNKVVEEIRQKEGVWLGLDGKWRTELSDENMAWNDPNGFEGILRRAERQAYLPIPLRDIIKHNELFKAYPKFAKETRVIFDRDITSDYLASYNRDDKIIRVYFRKNDVKNDTTGEFMLNDIAHEIQHAIQSEEDFSYGTWEDQEAQNNPKEFDKEVRERFSDGSGLIEYFLDQDIFRDGKVTTHLTEEEKKRFLKDWKNTRTKLIYESVRNPEQRTSAAILYDILEANNFLQDFYYSKHGEIEAQSSAIRRKFTDEERHLSSPIISLQEKARILKRHEDSVIEPVFIKEKGETLDGTNFTNGKQDDSAHKVYGRSGEGIPVWEDNGGAGVPANKGKNKKVSPNRDESGLHKRTDPETGKASDSRGNRGEQKAPSLDATRLQQVGETRRQIASEAQTKFEDIADADKDVFSVTFTEDSLKYKENRSLRDYYKGRKAYWKEINHSDGSVTYERKVPKEHHKKTITYSGLNGKEVDKRKLAKFSEKLRAMKDQAVKALFNDKHYLYKAAKLVGAEEAYQEMMVVKDQGSVASSAVERGIVKHGEWNKSKQERTASLNSIIDAIGEEKQQDFLDYCIAHRVANDLAKLGIEQKLTVEEARNLIDRVKKSENGKLFEEQRKKFIEYNQELLWQLVDGEIMTEEAYNDLIEKHPNFVPLSKDFPELDTFIGNLSDPKSLINQKSPIMKIGTSFREVKNPFLEMIKRTGQYYQIASRNKAGSIFVNDVAKKITQLAGGDEVMLHQGLIRKLKQRYDSTGRPIGMESDKNKIFFIYNKGVKEYYQVADNEVFLALKSFDDTQMKGLMRYLDKFCHVPSALVRTTATAVPDFGVRNLIRDNVEAFLTTDHGFLPFVDAFWGMNQMRKDTKWFREYQSLNGEMNILNREGQGKAIVEHNLADKLNPFENMFDIYRQQWGILKAKESTKGQKLKALAKLTTSPAWATLKSLKSFNDYLEIGTRVGEYKNARMGYEGTLDRLGDKRAVTLEEANKTGRKAGYAAFKAKEITLNFGQHGTAGKVLNRYIPFFNATLQGIYKTGNMLGAMCDKNHPRRAELIFKSAVIACIALGIAAAGHGDPDYDEAPQYERENFWILPNGIRIPKDQVLGKMIGNSVEYAYKQILDGEDSLPEATVKILGNIAEQFTPDSFMPAIMDFSIGWFGDYDMFTGKRITPEYMADKMGYLQKDISTSKIAVDLSEAIYAITGYAPGAKKIDWAMKNLISNSAKYASALWELTGDNEKMARGSEPGDEYVGALKDSVPPGLNLVTGTFATNRNSFQSISDFYERHRELKKLSSDEQNMTAKEKKAWTFYEKAYKEDAKARKELKRIKEDSSLTGAQKRQKADKIFKQQIKMAQKLKDWEKRNGLN